ncbi:MAG: hypothetical protein RLZZ387_1622 [Chloroflexota bacterium]|jgi:hypothetical protein
MNDFLSAPVPRNLRVRASLQVASTRLPARSFVLLMALVLVGGLAVARGADLTTTAQSLGAVAAVSITALEGRWWGYSTWALAWMAAAHLARPGQLELGPQEIALPPEAPSAPVSRRPRWHA